MRWMLRIRDQKVVTMKPTVSSTVTHVKQQIIAITKATITGVNFLFIFFPLLDSSKRGKIEPSSIIYLFSFGKTLSTISK